MPSERESDLVETLVDRQVVHSSKYLTFAHDTIADAAGRQHTREVVLHPGAVTVAAVLPDGRVLLVRQYRHAAGKVMSAPRALVARRLLVSTTRRRDA